MEVYFGSEKYSDVQLSLNDGEIVTVIPGHRAILGQRSPFFEALFSFSEKQGHDQGKPIPLEVNSVEAALNLIAWIYLVDFSLVHFKYFEPTVVALAKQWMLIHQDFDPNYPTPRGDFTKVPLVEDGRTTLRAFNGLESTIYEIDFRKDDGVLEVSLLLTDRKYLQKKLVDYLKTKLKTITMAKDRLSVYGVDTINLLNLILANNTFSDPVKAFLKKYCEHN